MLTEYQQLLKWTASLLKKILTAGSQSGSNAPDAPSGARLTAATKTQNVTIAEVQTSTFNQQQATELLTQLKRASDVL